MPWRLRPKKDAETGETFRGSCIQAENPEYPNGATPPESCLETACRETPCSDGGQRVN